MATAEFSKFVKDRYYMISFLWASLIAQLVKNPPAMHETQFDSWEGKIHWRRDRLPTPVFMGFPCGSAGKESACNTGNLGSGLENSMDCTIHEVAKSQTQLSDFHFYFSLSSLI